jgi:hypothetical protein
MHLSIPIVSGRLASPSRHTSQLRQSLICHKHTKRSLSSASLWLLKPPYLLRRPETYHQTNPIDTEEGRMEKVEELTSYMVR